MSSSLQFLRPSQAHNFNAGSKVAYPAYLRFFCALFRCHRRNVRQLVTKSLQPSPVRDRVNDIGLPPSQLYPRFVRDKVALTCRSFRERFAKQQLTDNEPGNDTVVVHGRVSSFRIAGSKLFFIDLVQDGCRVQGVCNFRRLSDSESQLSLEDFKRCYHQLQRGDILRLRGIPYRADAGEISVLLSELPQILSPCLHDLPTELHDKQTRVRKRYVDLIVNSQTADILRVRARIISQIRHFFMRDGFMEVQTPILADSAGGAVARAFETSATEFPNKRIALRIAPELWLKRLILGGFDRVFEIGPSFRNEGLDSTHNPEFTTCEFYKAYADITELKEITEKLFSGLAMHVNQMVENESINLTLPTNNYSHPYKTLNFIPSLEAAMNRQLPNLTSPDAHQKVYDILQDLSIPSPLSPTLPQLLDRLSSTFLEPQCVIPTWITNHPECLSPLAKSFEDPTTKQQVSARAELFVNGQEIVNTYEEENSPFEQRRKFIDQLSYRSSGDNTSIDESYLEALEWGLPPTGGWGCGIDRLCMLMMGVGRIGDVLSFGTLRNVVSLGQGQQSR